MRQKVFGTLFAATLVVLLTGCGGVSREKFATKLDNLDESNAKTFAPIFKKMLLALFDGKIDELQRLDYVSDKDALAVELDRMESLMKAAVDKADDILEGPQADLLNAREKRQLEGFILTSRGAIAALGSADGDYEKFLEICYEKVRTDLVGSFYDAMKCGEFEFVSEDVNDNTGVCLYDINRTRQTCHFVKIDGQWKTDALENARATNEALMKFVAEMR